MHCMPSAWNLSGAGSRAISSRLRDWILSGFAGCLEKIQTLKEMLCCHKCLGQLVGSCALDCCDGKVRSDGRMQAALWSLEFEWRGQLRRFFAPSREDFERFCGVF